MPTLPSPEWRQSPRWPLTWERRLPVFPGVTTVLSMTTLMIGSRTSLPNTNCFIKAIDVYLGICFSFVFGALLEYAVAHYSSLQQMAAKDRVRILRAVYMIHHLCHVLVGRDGLDLVTRPLLSSPPNPSPSSHNSICSSDSHLVQVGASRSHDAFWKGLFFSPNAMRY